MADDFFKTSQQLLEQMPADEREELQAIAEENADAVVDQGADPLQMLGLRGAGMDDETIAGALDIGAQLVRQGMYEQAFKYFMGMVQLDPLNWQVYRMLGIIQHRQRQHVLAAQLYVLSLTIHEDPLTLLYLGECEIHFGQTEIGLGNVKKALDGLRGQAEYKAFVKRGEQILASQAAKAAK